MTCKIRKKKRRCLLSEPVSAPCLLCVCSVSVSLYSADALITEYVGIKLPDRGA